jgi:hypothetical protein
MDPQAPMAAGHGHAAAGDGRGRIRASDADRDQVAGLLGTAYGEGRLSREEYDARLESTFSARTYGDLDELVTDLPVPQAPQLPQVAQPNQADKVNGLAIASLACGVGQLLVGLPATIAALVLGYAARRQIKRTGERGRDMALGGLALGWFGVAVLVIVVLIMTVGMHAGGPGVRPAP